MSRPKCNQSYRKGHCNTTARSLLVSILILTIAQSASAKTFASITNTCIDIVPRESKTFEWYDAGGTMFNCGWYEQSKEENSILTVSVGDLEPHNAYNARCRKHGNRHSKFDMKANDACCVCGGGIVNDPLTSSPTSAPSTSFPTLLDTKSPSNSPTNHPIIETDRPSSAVTETDIERDTDDRDTDDRDIDMDTKNTNTERDTDMDTNDTNTERDTDDRDAGMDTNDTDTERDTDDRDTDMDTSIEKTATLPPFGLALELRFHDDDRNQTQMSPDEKITLLRYTETYLEDWYQMQLAKLVIQDDREEDEAQIEVYVDLSLLNDIPASNNDNERADDSYHGHMLRRTQQQEQQQIRLDFSGEVTVLYSSGNGIDHDAATAAVETFAYDAEHLKATTQLAFDEQQGSDSFVDGLVSEEEQQTAQKDSLWLYVESVKLEFQTPQNKNQYHDKIDTETRVKNIVATAAGNNNINDRTVTAVHVSLIVAASCVLLASSLFTVYLARAFRWRREEISLVKGEGAYPTGEVPTKTLFSARTWEMFAGSEDGDPNSPARRRAFERRGTDKMSNCSPSSRSSTGSFSTGIHESQSTDSDEIEEGKFMNSPPRRLPRRGVTNSPLFRSPRRGIMTSSPPRRSPRRGVKGNSPPRSSPSRIFESFSFEEKMAMADHIFKKDYAAASSKPSHTRSHSRSKSKSHSRSHSRSSSSSSRGIFESVSFEEQMAMADHLFKEDTIVPSCQQEFADYTTNPHLFDSQDGSSPIRYSMQEAYSLDDTKRGTISDASNVGVGQSEFYGDASDIHRQQLCPPPPMCLEGLSEEEEDMYSSFDEEESADSHRVVQAGKNESIWTASNVIPTNSLHNKNNDENNGTSSTHSNDKNSIAMPQSTLHDID